MTTQTSAAIAPKGHVLGLIGAGHFLSHYYHICLPVLFPLLHNELGVSYIALGLILTIFNLASGAAQVPIGFLVDRLGAVTVLAGGLALEGGAILLMGLSADYALLLALAIVAGIGHAVFHPADYAILAAKVEGNWVGRAFSLHTFAGHLGTAAGPATIGLLLLFFDWRQTLMLSGGAAVILLIWIFSMWGTLHTGEIAPKKSAEAKSAASPQQDGWALLLSTPMILMFCFYIATSFTSSGVQSFSVTAFSTVQGMSTPMAGSILSAYLFASAFGVLGGGVLADYTKRHDLIAIGAFAMTAVVMLLLGATILPVALIAVLYTVIGFVQGAVRPARDMMTRAATPPGGMGKAFGFVSTGISLGSALAPILFGWLVDSGNPRWVFFAISLFMVVGILTVVSRRPSLQEHRKP